MMGRFETGGEGECGEWLWGNMWQRRNILGRRIDGDAK